MLKKLANGEYSLKQTFWLFGVFGILCFNLFANMTHNGVLRLICPYGKICSQSTIWFTLTNFANLLIGNLHNGIISALVIHFIFGAVFVAYIIITTRGLWKSASNYEGSKLWNYGAKVILIALILLSIKSII